MNASTETIWGMPPNIKMAKQLAIRDVPSLVYESISLRLPQGLLDMIKVEANKKDVPYQSLIKVWLAKAVEEARAHK